MTLSFRNGQFLLRGGASKEMTLALIESGWHKASDYYRTTNLKAAAEFRALADPFAEEVFNRAFNTIYGDPSLPPHLFSALDPHQIAGVKWILSRRRSYLAHSPGAGKTAQAIIASELLRTPGQNVFITPPSLVTNWEREIFKWSKFSWPTIGVVGASDKQDHVAWRAQHLIIPDSMITKPWVLDRLESLKINLLAVDEASRFKEPLTLRSQALYGGHYKGKSFSGFFRDANRVVFLDGSPMPNRPMELWAPLYALAPETIDCMDAHEFGMRYCGATLGEFGWEYNRSSNEEELRARIQKDFMHVVNESELKHPERRRRMIIMNRDVRSSENRAWDLKHLGSFSISDLDDSAPGDLARFRRELGLAKIPFIARYTQERLDKNESVLLFVWHREVAEALIKKLPKKAAMIIGGTPLAEREKILEDFQRGELRLIIGNIQALGRGHNIQRAERVIFGEFSWTDELNKQCEKRASRKGNAQVYTPCDYIVCPGSIDEPIARANFTKAKRVERVIG